MKIRRRRREQQQQQQSTQNNENVKRQNNNSSTETIKENWSGRKAELLTNKAQLRVMMKNEEEKKKEEEKKERKEIRQRREKLVTKPYWPNSFCARRSNRWRQGGARSDTS